MMTLYPFIAITSGLITSQNDTAPKRVIACHDGTIYKYSVIDEPAEGFDLDTDDMFEYIGRRNKNGTQEADTFRNVANSWGGKIEHFV